MKKSTALAYKRINKLTESGLYLIGARVKCGIAVIQATDFQHNIRVLFDLDSKKITSSVNLVWSKKDIEMLSAEFVVVEPKKTGTGGD